MSFVRLRLLAAAAAGLLTAASVSEAADGPALDSGGRPALTGQLLVATDRLRDPNFAGTVVYVARHDADGAFGLIVNRPIGSGPLGELIRLLDTDAKEGDDAPEAAGQEVTIRFGGPVERTAGFVLHTDDYAGEPAIDTGHGLAVSNHMNILADAAAGHGPRRLLFALGYSGWGPGQLEAELAREDWLTAPYEEDLVFGPEDAAKWAAAMATAGVDL